MSTALVKGWDEGRGTKNWRATSVTQDSVRRVFGYPRCLLQAFWHLTVLAECTPRLFKRNMLPDDGSLVGGVASIMPELKHWVSQNKNWGGQQELEDAVK
jgi:hypothetical protein